MSRDEQIKALYEEITAKQKQLEVLLKEEGKAEIDDYALVDADGQTVRLSELFGDKDDLILVHNMGRSCPYCTLWADGFNGVVPHLEDRAAFVVVSPDDPGDQKAFASSRGWHFRMLSDQQSEFTETMGFLTEHEGKPFPLPGASTFHRQEDGSIVRVAKTFFGPGDPYAGIWHLFALLDGGAEGWQPKFVYE